MKNKVKHLVKNPIYVPNKDLGLTDWLPPLDKEYINIESNSWFDIKFFRNPNADEEDIDLVTVPLIPPESFKQQMKSINKLKKKNPYLDKKPEFLYCRKIRIYPTNEQIKILHLWFNCFTDMYNVTVHHIRKKIFNKGTLRKNAKSFVGFAKNRKQLKKKRDRIKNLLRYNKMPTHMLDEAISLVCSNYSSCLTNLKRKNIKKFRVREWSKSKRKKILKIESSFFTSDTFCSRVFKTMNASDDFSSVTRTTTLQFDQDTGKYILLVPTALPQQQIIKPIEDAGGDMGVRSHITTYSKNGTYAFCNNAEQ